jgi:hypothetical protein
MNIGDRVRVVRGDPQKSITFVEGLEGYLMEVCDGSLGREDLPYRVVFPEQQSPWPEQDGFWVSEVEVVR